MNTQPETPHGIRALPLVLDAIDVVLRRLDLLAHSPDVVALRAAALRHLREAQEWDHARPDIEEQERLMRRVLGLHLGTAKLERDGLRP